jgi:hypothetical protein
MRGAGSRGEVFMRLAVVVVGVLCLTPAGTAAQDAEAAEGADAEAAEGADAVAVEEETGKPVPVPIVSARLPIIPPEKNDGVRWDAQVAGGGGFAFRGDTDHYLVRARAGVLFPRDPWIFAVGASGEVGGLVGLGGGFEVEALSLRTGLSLMAGFTYGQEGRWATRLGVGWSLLGVEWQRGYGASDALFFTVRIPLGVIFTLI